MSTGILKFSIDTYLNSKGFKDFKSNLKESMNLSQRFKSITGSTLGQLAIGYFTISGLVGQYNKAVEASNYQIEQEAKLYNTLRAQNFRDEQIKSIVDLTGSLQSLGVVGDEVTIAGAQQLATYRLQEDSIKKLLPTMQDLLVKQKGLNGTGQDMEGIANLFAKSMNGQTMALKRSGIILSEREEQLLKVGTEEQKVALLTEAVRRSIGEQNKEMLKTPEGKITSAKNRIGDLYETWGMSVRETRAKFWEFVADNAEGLKDVVNRVFKAGASFVDTFLGVFRDIKKGFNALPDSAKNAFKIIGGIALATQFPLIALVFAIEDVFAAFQGKESFTEDAINALLKLTGTDYRFADLRKGVSDFFDLLVKGADSGIEKINLTTKVLSDLLDTLKGGAGLLQMLWGATGGLAIDFTKNTYKALTGNFEDINWNNTTSNISNGWDRLYGAGQHMNDTHTMYQSYDLEQQEKKMKQKTESDNYKRLNQNKVGYPVDNEFIVPGSQPLFAGQNKANNNANIIALPNDLTVALNKLSKMQETKKLDTKTVTETKKMIKPEVTLTNTPTYNTTVTINEATDGAKVEKMIETGFRNYDTQRIKELKTQLGVINYGFGY
ncbi:hypothetical protein [Fusobacterium pseudoperiodonticum]|uniref:hypothetical protein n=1 Tax=Fusobacterium pseudoperiodonticum TaxID=2663009 RepID=UPI0028E1DFC6|nr:hypothetical protein [Fusobacterium pseudoperiodonticum]